MKTNINKAGFEELVAISGIGPVLAGRIIAYRQENRFKDVYELSNIKGLGRKRMSDIIDQVEV